jgi:hypothetical protein
MPSRVPGFESDYKHEGLLLLLKSIIKSGNWELLAKASSLGDLYGELRKLPSIGNFLAFQYAIDLTYASCYTHTEEGFVVPGPGARSGIRKCFSDLGDYSETDAIMWVTDRQEEEFSKHGLYFENLWGRSLQPIDCQNLFCEVDKYSRVRHPQAMGIGNRWRIKSVYKPGASLRTPWFPPKWGINGKIEDEKKEPA